MKRTLTLMALLTAGAAMAQTTVGNVTITRPSDVRTTPATRTPVTTRTPAATSAPVRSTAHTAVPSDLPAGWRHLSGRVVPAQDVRLPAGSRVQVTLEDTKGGSPLVKFDFAATSLSTPYSVQYNPVRLNANNTYVVRAKVFDKSGKVLYTTQGQHKVPAQRAASMNIRVVKAN